MLKLTSKLYRTDYTGEDIIQERVLQDGEWVSTTEHVPNNVINNQISNRAVVFGNGESRLGFNVSHLLNKKSGLLGADTLQSYACNAFYREYTPDFLVVTSRTIAEEISRTNYPRDNIVYTRVDISLEFPRKFYLVPHDPYADAGATAAYIACFDGHKKIYLLGCEGQHEANYNNNVYAGTSGYGAKDADITGNNWEESYLQLFQVYDDVDFVLVTPNGRYTVKDSWKARPNFRQISHRDMVLEADL
jgi:hypothetical protein